MAADNVNDEPMVALCPGCAKETGADTEANMIEPQTQHELSCQHCGAILAGFFYRVPEAAYSGMAPGAG